MEKVLRGLGPGYDEQLAEERPRQSMAPRSALRRRYVGR
jgi:hypothetical protein